MIILNRNTIVEKLEVDHEVLSIISDVIVFVRKENEEHLSKQFLDLVKNKKKTSDRNY